MEAEVLDSQIIVETPDLTGAAYVFTVGQLLSDFDRARVPAWKHMGGIIKQNPCLEYRHGFIQRCEITELRQHMESHQVTNLHPDKRELAVRTFRMSAINPNTQQFEDRIIGLKEDGTPDHLLRRPHYPKKQIASLCSANDGLVQITAITNNRERKLAQLWLFPNWGNLTSGVDEMPQTIGELRAYFIRRRNTLTPDDPHFQLFLGVANAAIQSCDDYMTWGTALLQAANKDYSMYQAKGQPYSYGTHATLLFTQLNQRRLDMIAQRQDDTLDKLTAAITTMAEAQIRTMQAQTPPVAAPPAEPNAPTPAWAAPDVTVAEMVDHGAAPEPSDDNPKKFAVGVVVKYQDRLATIREVRPAGNLLIEYHDTKEQVGVRGRNVEVV